MADSKAYLNPEVLSRIAKLDLKARLIVEGFISGLHKSPYHGISVEFAEHREYTPGDDLKHLDWRVFARSDRFYIKQYEEETNLVSHLIVDGSESMRYASGAMSKYDYACSTAAALAFLLLRQQDSVGLVLFDEEIRVRIPPSAKPPMLNNMAHEMAQLVPERKTSVSGIFHQLAEEIPRRGLVVLLSDLFVPLEDLKKGLRHFRYAGQEVLVVHVLDEYELTFPFDGNVRFKGLEELPDLLVEPRPLRRAYLDAVGAFTSGLAKWCKDHRIDYTLISTADRLDVVLAQYLASRSRIRRVARGSI
ncbi:MAG: DUF58 domain-containing protein [Planctomycetota bacterium]|jgi:uncharacterized protein (DUF58 family)